MKGWKWCLCLQLRAEAYSKVVPKYTFQNCTFLVHSQLHSTTFEFILSWLSILFLTLEHGASYAAAIQQGQLICEIALTALSKPSFHVPKYQRTLHVNCKFIFFLRILRQPKIIMEPGYQISVS